MNISNNDLGEILNLYLILGGNRTFYTSVGMIQTPNFPDRYPHHMNVRLEIPEYTDTVINLTIDVKETDNCFDTVLVIPLNL